MTKQEARKKYREIRMMLTPSLVQMASDNISDQLIKMNFKNQLIHVFLPIKKFNEIDLRLFIEHCFTNRISLCTSVSNFKEHKMETVNFQRDTVTKENNWGIPEPQNSLEIEPSLVDVVIIPLLYADEKGNRVGYGKGFYDRFLASCKEDVIKIGVNFFAPNEDLIDIEQTDIKLDQLVIAK